MKPLFRAAFSLVEVTLAMGVAAFCLVTLIALLPVGIQSQQSASEETASINIGQGIFADLRACNVRNDATSAVSSARYHLTVPTSGTQQTALFFDADGNRLSTAADVARVGRYAAVLTFLVPSAPSASIAAVEAHLVITWPAQACKSAPDTQSTAYDPTKPGTNDLRAQLTHTQGTVEMIGTFDNHP